MSSKPVEPGKRRCSTPRRLVNLKAVSRFVSKTLPAFNRRHDAKVFAISGIMSCGILLKHTFSEPLLQGVWSAANHRPAEPQSDWIDSAEDGECRSSRFFAGEPANGMRSSGLQTFRLCARCVHFLKSEIRSPKSETISKSEGSQSETIASRTRRPQASVSDIRISVLFRISGFDIRVWIFVFGCGRGPRQVGSSSSALRNPDETISAQKNPAIAGLCWDQISRVSYESVSGRAGR